MAKLVVANWKMNPQSYKEAELLAEKYGAEAKKHKNVHVVLCPPYPWLTDMSHEKKDRLEYGAQDVFWEDPTSGGGAYTGEVSASMLRNSKVKYAIIGHSERRCHLAETDAMIRKKVTTALHAGLTAILCVGEPLALRKKGAAESKKFVGAQLKENVRALDAKGALRLIVAYEPVWSISTSGTGLSELPEDAAKMISFIKDVLRAKSGLKDPKVLYGGSVNAKNVEEFLKQREINGVLVGGASVRPEEFVKIIQIAASV